MQLASLDSLTPLDLIVLLLATYRLANMLVTEDGPKSFVARIRQIAGVGKRPEPLFGGVLGCVLCCSVWVGVALFTLWMLFPLSHYLIWALAVSGGACLAFLGTRNNIRIEKD